MEYFVQVSYFVNSIGLHFVASDLLSALFARVP